MLYLLAVVMMSLALLKAFFSLVNSYAAVLYHHKPRTMNSREYRINALVVLVPGLVAIWLTHDWAITWIVESYARLAGHG